MARDKNFGVAGRLGGIGGTYGRKAENLTKKELKKAGGAKAAAGPNVDITKTTRDYSRGITLGPKGKPLTGRVKLQNGNMAVYKAGKRVVAAAPGKKNPNGAGSGVGNGSGKGRNGATPTLSLAQRKAVAAKANQNFVARPASSVLPSTRAGASTPANAGRGDGRPTASSGMGRGDGRPIGSVSMGGQKRGAGTGGRGAGPGSAGPGGTPAQQKIRNLENRIASQRAALERQRKRENQTAAQKQQADRDSATLKNLEKTLSDLKNKAKA